MVNGIRVDYLAPTLYLVDLVWLGWMGTKSITNYELLITNWKKIFSFRNLIILLFVGVNIVLAGNRWEAGYKWVRIGQWAITFGIFKLQSSNFNIKKMLEWIIPCWVVVEAFLVVGQVVMGHNVGGIFYWLGERRFSFNTIGIAQMSWWGNGVVRAYGTFSHPNSLAGFTLISWLLWSRYQNLQSSNFNLQKKTIWWVVNWLMILIMVLAGSRIVWLILLAKLLITNYQLLITNKKKKIGWGVAVVGMILILVGYLGNKGNQGILGGWDTESLSKRLELNLVALGMIKENPLFGVGAGNFLNKLPEYQQAYRFYWLQPVHNIFLLAWSEVGSLGIIIAIQLLITNYELRIKDKTRFWIIGAVLVTGMVDHYWLTLPQNSWLLAVVFSMI